MTVRSHPSPTAPEADIKTFPSPPPTIERTCSYIEERVFGNFQNFREPRFKMSEPRFWVFSPLSGKGVNTRTDNLRVHTTGSDTRTTSVGTTALSHNIVFICGDINVLGWDPWVLFWENFRLWRPNRAFGWLEWRSHGCPKVSVRLVIMGLIIAPTNDFPQRHQTWTCVQVYVQGGKNPLRCLNHCNKITHENILQLVKLHEIVDRLKTRKIW